ncbi:Peptidase M3A/M3B [Carpediemonas membranifera]|uniref:Peptidase M3A/M3B n=1 Tax=Carpediemonas membranifera TaxID=201153 RepID=A0A8J6EA90_9EUKA|nr:Peptidase M3A/M3B [Carpediemonas membranifera]|eukprot:KAG9394360.1 Peptidase M3A/M3B [Carpediemonas membranifera]
MDNAVEAARSWLERINKEYCELHTTKEDAFWANKMGTGGSAAESSAVFAAAEEKLQEWNHSPKHLEECEEHCTNVFPIADAGDMVVTALKGWQYFFRGNVLKKEESRTMFKALLEAEQKLEVSRSDMPLGYLDPETQEHKLASSVQLATMMRTGDSRELRKAAWEGLRTIEGFVLDHDFLDVVKRRNALARSAGFVDYYAMTVERVENMTKDEIFDILSKLVELTEDATVRAVAELKKREPDLKGYDLPYLMGGDITKKLDPFFPFEKSVSRWGQTFGGMNVDYSNATVTIDLLDRSGKYSNGFCHAPEVSWVDRGKHVPARVNFSSNGIVGMVGSGQRAINTVLHEAGHCAHFANIMMPAPCFAQEFLMSVAYAETQSMFMDSLISDGDWMHLVAGIPIELIKENIEAKQPFAALSLRSMLTIPFAERAIYELPDAELTPDNVIRLIREVETRLLGGLESARPVLSMPHLLSNESSAYYHAYVLAMCGVEQTRRFFLDRDGHIFMNPKVGPEVSEKYWHAGNSRTFAQHIEHLTGSGPDPAFLAEAVNRTVDEEIAVALKSIETGKKIMAELGDKLVDSDAKVHLNARVKVQDGHEQVVDTVDFVEASNKFAAYVASKRE